MNGQTAIRGNRTGITLLPEMATQMIQGARELTIPPEGDLQSLAKLRAPYLSEGEMLGSPPPVPAETASGAEMGIAVLFDKLGERLAFERAGVRLYDAMLSKMEGATRRIPGPSVRDVQHMRDEEASHFELLSSFITELGGDPTFVTPAADACLVASSGIPQVLSDPRTTIEQCLGALLTAELTDNDGWMMLIELTQRLGFDSGAQRFQAAHHSEGEHLIRVREWLRAVTSGRAESPLS